MSDDAILIIDDDADLRDLVRLVVEPTNVDVLEAATWRRRNCRVASESRAGPSRLARLLHARDGSGMLR